MWVIAHIPSAPGAPTCGGGAGEVSVARRVAGIALRDLYQSEVVVG